MRKDTPLWYLHNIPLGAADHLPRDTLLLRAEMPL